MLRAGSNGLEALVPSVKTEMLKFNPPEIVKDAVISDIGPGPTVVGVSGQAMSLSVGFSNGQHVEFSLDAIRDLLANRKALVHYRWSLAMLLLGFALETIALIVEARSESPNHGHEGTSDPGRETE